MKICFLTNTLNIGSGWGRYSWEVVSRMAKQPDIEVIVLTEEKSGSLLEKVILQHSLKNLFFVFLNALKARKYIKQAEVIHCLDAYPYGIIAALANLGLNKKLILSVVGSYSIAPLEQENKQFSLAQFYRKIRGNLLGWAYQKAEAVLSISSFTEKEVLKRVRLKNSQVVHLGIDFDKFQISNYIDKDKTEKIILSVGGLKRRKGYHISIPAIAKVKEKYPHLKYYIVGDQDNQNYFRELKNIVKENHLADKVIFLEKISDQELIKLYRQADLFLLTSVNVGHHFEGFGLVFLEAGACGKPVVGTNNCGIEDAIRDGFNGFLVPQNDIEKTAQAVLKILDSPSLAQQLGKNGRELAQEMSWQKTINQYLKIYHAASS